MHLAVPTRTYALSNRRVIISGGGSSCQHGGKNCLRPRAIFTRSQSSVQKIRSHSAKSYDPLRVAACAAPCDHVKFPHRAPGASRAITMSTSLPARKHAAHNTAPPYPTAWPKPSPGKTVRETRPDRLPPEGARVQRRSPQREKRSSSRDDEKGARDDRRGRAPRAIPLSGGATELVRNAEPAFPSPKGAEIFMSGTAESHAPQPTQLMAHTGYRAQVTTRAAPIEVHIDGVVLQLRPLPGACFQLVASPGVAREARQRLRQALETNNSPPDATQGRKLHYATSRLACTRGEEKVHAP